MDAIHRSFATAGLVRGDNRWVGGVCSGLAAKMGCDAGAIRLAMVLLLLLPGSQLVIYPVLWICMPDRQTAARLVGTAPAHPAPGTAAPRYPQDRV